MKLNQKFYHKFLGELTVSSFDGEKVMFYETSEIVFNYGKIKQFLCDKEEYFSNVYDAELLKKSVELRKIKNMIHVTTINNAKNILKKGIVPRKFFRNIRSNSNSFINDFKAKTNRVTDDECEVSDTTRWDGRTDHSCFSITKCNSSLIKSYYQKNDYIYCMLKLKPSLLYKAFGNEHFFYYNAACNCFKGTAKKSLDDFNKMFLKEFSLDLYRGKVHCSRIVSSNRTTSEQAEVLIGACISPKFIEEIVFSNEDEKEKFLNEVDKSLIQNIKISVGSFIYG